MEIIFRKKPSIGRVTASQHDRNNMIPLKVVTKSQFSADNCWKLSKSDRDVFVQLKEKKALLFILNNSEVPGTPKREAEHPIFQFDQANPRRPENTDKEQIEINLTLHQLLLSQKRQPKKITIHYLCAFPWIRDPRTATAQSWMTFVGKRVANCPTFRNNFGIVPSKWIRAPTESTNTIWRLFKAEKISRISRILITKYLRSLGIRRKIKNNFKNNCQFITSAHRFFSHGLNS